MDRKAQHSHKRETIADFYRHLKALPFRDVSEEQDLYWLDHDLVGNDAVFQGPFGRRRCVYMDHTASGKPMHFIEQFIYKNVLPVYANTHTTISFTSAQTTNYRKEARDVIRECTNASKDDVVLFCGSGATAAIHKLVHMIQVKGDRSPIVFVSPFEHHSNILPWRDMGALTINIPEDDYGTLDIAFLEKQLKNIVAKRKNKGRLLIGVFSATSNVTGALTDDVAITVLLHQYGGLAFWDYAGAAPHVKIDMNPITYPEGNYLESLARKDAIYFSGHKFIGGPQTPGVLIAKSHVFRNKLPHNGGGGTVFFVTPERHQYLQDKVEREEGGTPAIIESIRLGLVMALQKSIGVNNIIAREALFARRALERWAKVPEIIVLGNPNSVRGPIISFLVVHLQTGYFLHQNFVVALLNDLFGIQCRGGCMCAGPYSQILLGIDLKIAHKYEKLLSQDSRLFRDPYGNHKAGEPEYDMVFKPGFTRISFPVHASMEEIDFVIDAVELVARFGWKLLPLYALTPEDSTFFYCPNFQSRDGLDNKNKFKGQSIQNKEKNSSFSECLQYARYLFDNIETMLKSYNLNDDTKKFNPSFSSLRWFLLTSESLEVLHNSQQSRLIQSPMPFCPKVNVYKITEFQRWSPGSIPFSILRNSCWGHDEVDCQYLAKVLEINAKFKASIRRCSYMDVLPIPDIKVVEETGNEEYILKKNIHSKKSGAEIPTESRLSRKVIFTSMINRDNYLLPRLVKFSRSNYNLEQQTLDKDLSGHHTVSRLSSGYHSETSLNLISPLAEQAILIEENLATNLKGELYQMKVEVGKAIEEIAVELRNEIRKNMSISQDLLLSPQSHCMRHAHNSSNGNVNSDSYHNNQISAKQSEINARSLLDCKYSASQSQLGYKKNSDGLKGKYKRFFRK